MEIVFINRKLNPMEISIEKLFSIIKNELKIRDIEFKDKENPYSFGLKNIFKGMIYFSRHQEKDKIFHITGDIHWAAILLNPKNTILTVHDIGRYYELSGLRRMFFYFLWILIPIKRLKYITTISQKTKTDIISLIPWAENKIKVIPNPITIDKIEIKKKNTGKTVILIVGTRSNKNVEKSLISISHLNSIKVIVVGKLSEEQEKIVQTSNFDFENRIFVPEEELMELYTSADILLFASLFEGFGLPILEGQASRCIVITSNISPMKEVAGEGAIFVDPLDSKSILFGVETALSLSEDEKNLLLHKGQMNLNNYSVKNVVNQYIEVYKEVEKNML